MPLHLAPLLETDIPTCLSIYFAAFQNSHSLACWPRDVPTVTAWWEKMFRDELREDGAFWLKAVLTQSSTSSPGEEGILVGYCKWIAPKHGEVPSVDLPEWPEGADGKLCEETFGHWARSRRSLMGGRGHWYLEMIATDPKYQGQGAGSLMLKWGVERADRDGVECYLESSPEALKLYEKFGFREVERLDTWIENERVKGEWYREVFMIRPATKPTPS